ncbi:hypothetical protein ABW19_dt0207571 [Dactylella cylindrospora]|nr:hypothetical protein ABW19_dt0207571 [Dactylella cylindrospora]
MSSKHTPTAILAEDDDEYNSSEDEDFNPDQHPDRNDEDPSSSSESENEGDSKPTRRPSKRKIKDVAPQDDPVNDDSGDEAVIASAKAKRKKIKGENDDDEGGEGGLIKTRAQRAREEKERVPLSTTTAATVDVDALWKSLNAPTAPPKPKPVTGTQSTIQTITTSRIEPTSSQLSSSTSVKTSDEVGIQVATAEATTAVPLPAALGTVLPIEGVESRIETTATIPAEKDGMVTIKRTYEFAGETITEEKQVPANSFEARAYLSSLQTGVPPVTTSNPAKPLRRPMKRVSKFDPGNVSGGAKKATKLNTLEKSRLDWAGYVDKEGIGEELDRQRKQGGDSYLERQDFLGRVGQRTSERK